MGPNYSMWDSNTVTCSSGGANRPKLQLEWFMPAEGIRGAYLPGFFRGARPAGFPRGVWLPLRAVGNMSLAWTVAEQWP